ncbi:MAG: hypothetical protein M1828_007156 [Chrysothrix sp. TS-e1954]|nr:MAG: hypothetical protein M1828_007156 [Chrysothrix sp. TS-e1954]
MDDTLLELPGEAYPLNASTLYHTLVNASSRDSQQIQTGTRQLEAWETHEGYYTLLQDAYIAHNLPNELRLLALIQLKNGVDKHWRKVMTTTSLANGDKTTIRDRLLSSTLDESNPQYTRLGAIVIARVARCDFPTQWPNLLTDIAEILRQSARSTTVKLDTALEIVLQVVKELATIRIGAAKAALQSSTNELLYVLDDLSADKIQPWLQAMRVKAGSTEDIIPLMATSAKILKVNRRLAIAGCQNPHHEAVIQRQWQASSKLFASFLELFMQQSLDNACRGLLARHMLHFVKFQLNMARTHPVSFGLLPGTRELIGTYWNTAKAMRERQQKHPDAGGSEHETYFFDKFNLQTLLLLRTCFKIAYSPHQAFSLRQKPDRDEMELVKSTVRDVWLPDDFVMDVFENLLSKFFVCVQNDLEEWAADGEEWEMKEEGTEDAIELSVRPCAERLFLDLVINRKSLVQGRFRDVESLLSDNSDPLVKDAAYSALGIAAPAIYSLVKFEDVLDKHIISDLTASGQNQNVVRRRIAILTAQWVRVEIAAEKLPTVYQIYQHLLDRAVPSNDEAVRITAGKRLLDVITVWTFKSEVFASFAPAILSSLASLISEVNLVETKLALLDTLGAVIERMELRVGQLANQIVSLLPPLWEESGNENMLQQSVISILSKLVCSLKAESAPLHPLVIPVMTQALDPESESRIYLLEDALDLMHQVVLQSQSASAPLLSLVHFVLPILDWDEELLDTAMKIIESLLLLAPAHMLEDESIRSEMLIHLTGLLGAKKRRTRDPAGDIVELVIRKSEDAPRFKNAIGPSLMQTELISTAISSIVQRYTDNAVAFDDNLLNYFVMFSRLILLDPALYSGLINAWCESKQQDREKILSIVLQQWLAYMDQVTMPAKSKLMCLAFATLAGTGQSWVLRQFEGLLSAWTTVVLELREEDSTDGRDSLVYKTQEETHVAGESPEDARRRQLTRSDPIHTVSLPHYLKENLEQVVKQNGGESRFEATWITNIVDPGTWSFFKSNIINVD